MRLRYGGRDIPYASQPDMPAGGAQAASRLNTAKKAPPTSSGEGAAIPSGVRTEQAEIRRRAGR